MLKGIGVSKYFEGLAAIKNVDFVVEEKKITGLIGPNGAGKTTLFNCISGIYHPTSGVVKFRGREISRLKPSEVCRLGIGRTFQIVRPFLNLTVTENVMAGAIFGQNKRISIEDAKSKTPFYLEFVGLKEKKDYLAQKLTLQERKMLELSRALATEPRLILIDEAASGLSPTETIEAMNVLRRIRDELGITIFWVEHVMKAVMEVAEHIMVLHHGEKIAEGIPKEIAKDSKVIDAYLGERYIL